MSASIGSLAPTEAVIETGVVLRSELRSCYRLFFKKLLAGLDPCLLPLARSRLEGLLAFLGTFDDVVSECWPWLVPRLVGHSPQGFTVAGAGCEVSTNHGECPKLSSPQRVAITPDGSILVADWGNHRLCRWKEGRGQVFIDGAIDFTYGICCDSSGAIYATTTDAVVCIGGSGQLRQRGWLQVCGSAGLCDHCGLCADRQGGLFVADHLNDRILHVQSPGVILVVLGPLFFNGDSMERLNCPADVELSRDGELFVADRGSGRILQCRNNGMASILASGLKEPYSLASRNGYLYVGEFGNNQVRRIHIATGSSSKLLDVRSPTGLCFDRAANLYVTERDANRVLRFEKLVD